MKVYNIIRTVFKKIKLWYLVIFAIIFVIAIPIRLYLLFGYVWTDGTGFAGKTLWDWLELLIIPVVLGLGAWYLNHEDKKNEHELAVSRFQETTLQQYFDQMNELILKDNLSFSPEKSDVVKVAYSRTLTTLRQLEINRKEVLIQYLIDSGLIYGLSRNLRLDRADLRKIVLDKARLLNASLYKVNFEGAKLIESNLQLADLMMASLKDADLSNSNLTGVDLTKADLRNSCLKSANLDGANLYKADLRECDFREANLRGANIQFANFLHSNITQDQIDQTRLKDHAILSNGLVLLWEEDYSLPRESRLSVDVLRGLIDIIDKYGELALSFTNPLKIKYPEDGLNIPPSPYSLKISQNMFKLYLTIHDKDGNEMGLFTHSNLDVNSARNYIEEFGNDYIHTLSMLLPQTTFAKMEIAFAKLDHLVIRVPYPSTYIPDRIIELAR